MRNEIAFIGIVFIMTFVSLDVNSQTCEVLNQYVDQIYTKDEIHKLENQVCKLLKKQHAIPVDNKVNIYYIPDYDLPDYSIVHPDSIQKFYLLGKSGWRIKKGDLLDGSFLNKLSRQTFNSFKNKYGTMNADFIVTNSSDSLIAYGGTEQFSIFIANRYTEDTNAGSNFLLNKIHELKFKKLFKLSKHWVGPIFGITDKDEIVVIMYDKGHKIYTIKDFIDLNMKDKWYKDNLYD